MTNTADIHFIKFLELIQNPALGPVICRRFQKVISRKEVKLWLQGTGLLNVLKSLEIDWALGMRLTDGLDIQTLKKIDINMFGSMVIPSTIMFQATPEQLALIKPTLLDLMRLQTYDSALQQEADQRAKRYEQVQRRRYASLMTECAKIREQYPDLK